MVDAQPTEDFAIDPPLGESDAPLMGNPVLMRGAGTPRRRSAASSRGASARGSNKAMQMAVPIAAVAIIAAGGAFYLAARSHQAHPLMTTPPPSAVATAPAEPTAPPAAIASTAPRAAAPIAPTATAPPPEAAPPAAAPRHERVTRMARAERVPPRAVRHTATRARAAEENGADVSATAPSMSEPAAPPAPPPVLTPPPAPAPQ